MKIVLFNNILHTLNLPSKVDGSFSLQDIPNSDDIIANIEEQDNNWVMNTTSDYKIMKGNLLLNSEKIEIGNFYILRLGQTKKLVYVEDGVDSTFKIYKVNVKCSFVVGKDSKSHICYNNNYVLNQHLALFYENNSWKCQLAPNSSVYINRVLITEQNINLKNGDILYLYGLKIIIMGNTIMINNPGNKVMINSNNLITYNLSPQNISYGDIKELDFYSENDYFFKTPRMRRFIETYQLKFANAPNVAPPEEMPLILTLGPTVTMGMISAIQLFNTISGLISKTMTLGQAAPRLLSAFAMLAGCLLWPTLIRKYNKKKALRQIAERTEKYHKYLEKKQHEMAAEAINQSQILKENLMTLDECYQTIINRKRILWERKISQKDFLTVRVGIGDVPIDMDIQFSENEFKIEEDPLNDEAVELVNQNKTLIGVPVDYSFYDKKAVAIMGIEYKFKGFIDNIILQLITYHSYDDLKIVILTDKKNESKWLTYKNLPHCFSNNKSIRFFASDSEELKTISNYLEQEIMNRANMGGKDAQEIETVENEDKDIQPTFSPYYLIFTDCFSKVRRLGISELILKNKMNFGFGFVIIENSLGKLPSECVDFISLGNQTSGILSNELNNYYHQDFKDEINNKIDMEKCCEVLANIPIEFYEDIRFLPKSLGFLEMQKVGKVEQLNSLNRWRINDPTKSLRAAIGVNDLENIIYLDLHEKYHGPHGLIAGMTGSGKSEFIITYILSMALNYSPNEVSFILIDYKGGGLAGAFENKTQNIRLPHLAGTITNLDKAELNRTLVSIDSELRRRQKMFNEARDKLGESTIDIYKYQKFYRQRKIKEAIPHLFIICDEFAELKSQQPDFMENLISTARIGRSLGVHLILATQKPTGVVNDQIWSNSKFRVCLKVQDRSDSNEMIKKPDAAEIKEPGRFYLQVGYDELYLYGQSGWCGTPYVPSDIVNKETDHSINYLDNIGSSIKDYDGEEVQPKVLSNGDELSNVLKYLCELSKRENVYSPRLWLDNIPGDIYTESIIKKYNYVPEKFNLEAIVGEYDDPSNQRQDILKIELNSEGNTLIFGTSSGNREMFIYTLVYSLCILHSTEEVNIYIFDFGSESLRVFKDMPHVGDVVFASEDEKVSKLNKMIVSEIQKRKSLFADYNGDYETYCKNSGKTLPRKIFIYNNLDFYRENYPNIDEDLVKYSREGLRYGIVIVISANSNSGMYSRMLRNFQNTFVLDMPNTENYVSILGRIGNVFPADYDGRGLFRGDLVYEFQTAQIFTKDRLTEYISKKIASIKEKNPIRAESIPILPNVITVDMLQSDHELGFKEIPIGIQKDNLEKCNYDFDVDKATLFISNEFDAVVNFVNGFIRVLKTSNKICTILIDANNKLPSLKDKVNLYVSDNLNDVINNLITNIPQGMPIMMVILGIEKFKGSLESTTFNNFIKEVKQNDNIRIVYADTQFKMKRFVFEPWYTETVVNINGVWLGNGIMDQAIIRVSDLSSKYKVKINNTFAWVVKNGNGELVKCIVAGDENEE